MFFDAIITALVESVMIGLIVLAVMRAWFMGSIFENKLSYWQTYRGLLGELLSCPLCLSYHIAFWCEVLVFVPIKIYAHAWIPLILFLPVVFAAAAVAQSVWFRYHSDWQ